MDSKYLLVLVLSILSRLANSEEVYENSTNICEKCKCITGPQFVLDCKDRGFKNVLANWPQHNTTLVATFSRNSISNLEILPASDLVTELVFDHCGIKTIDNGVFKDIRNIRFLDLSYNMLTTDQIGQEKFKGPYNDTVYEPLGITHLNLAYNQIHSLPHKMFEHLSDLKELNLEGNELRILDQPTQVALSALQNLRVLNLANNDLTELVGDAIKNLKNLKEINLSYNNLDFVPETLTHIGDSLESVYLDHNPIFELRDESFLGINGLKHVSLRYLWRLQDVTANTFTPLKNLTILHLCDNSNLIFIDKEAFGPNQTLEELYLHNNSLKQLDYNLIKWSSLKMLTLNDNEFNCDCNLFKISQELSKQITENKDGPICLNPINEKSAMVYGELSKDICDYKPNTVRIHHIIDRHFKTIRIILLILSVVVSLIALMTVLIGYLKYRRYKMNLNYPFVTQVMYNPLRTTTNP